VKPNRYYLRRYTPDWVRRYGPLRLLRVGLLDAVGMHFFTVNAVLQAVLSGVLTVSSVVLRKSLGASEIQMGIFSTIGAISLLIGIFASEHIAGRDKRPFILWTGMAGRAVCIAIAVAFTPWLFIIISGAFNILVNASIPATTALWQGSISPRHRSSLWGTTLAISTLVSMVVAYGTGLIMDHDPWAYRWLFPLAGLISMGGIWILVRVPLRGAYKLNLEDRARPNLHEAMVKPVIEFIELMKKDRAFARFENFFFLYGFAFMMLSPVVPAFMVDEAHMRYEQTQIASAVLFQIGMLVLPGFWGKLMDRRGPIRMCGVIFAMLALYPLLLLASPLIARLGIPLVLAVYFAHLVFGAGMSGIAVAWNLAPIEFAGGADSSRYTGAHVTLTGVRGMFAPLLGAIGLRYFGYDTVFIAAACVFATASAGMWWQVWEKARRAREQAVPAAAG
jgi:MFS family permease